MKSMEHSLRMLVCGDIHGSRYGVRTIRDLHREMDPGLTVVCGDITNFGDGREARKILDSLPGPVFAVPGNCDPPGVLHGIDASGAGNLHGHRLEFSGILFAGMGGAPTRYGAPFKPDDDSVRSMLTDLLTGMDVLVLHAPPYGHVDIARHGEHLGNPLVSDVLEEMGCGGPTETTIPCLVLSAHIHESRGIEVEGDMTYINPGPAKEGCAALVDIRKCVDGEGDILREVEARLL